MRLLSLKRLHIYQRLHKAVKTLRAAGSSAAIQVYKQHWRGRARSLGRRLELDCVSHNYRQQLKLPRAGGVAPNMARASQALKMRPRLSNAAAGGQAAGRRLSWAGAQARRTHEMQRLARKTAFEQHG